MNLLRIKYFVEAAGCSSFSEAARRLFTTQPNLSRQISAMEDELGVKLFQRGSKVTRLTPAGQYLYGQLRDIPEITDRAFEQVRAYRHGEQISIGILEGIDISSRLTAGLTKLQREYPELEFRLERNHFKQLRSGLNNFNYDLILTLAFELESLERVEYTTLVRQQGSIGMSIDHPKAALSRLSLFDFRNEDFLCISPEESPGGYRLLLDSCARAGFTPRIVRQMHSSESLILGVETGLGVTVLDRHTSRLLSNPRVRLAELEESYNADLLAIWRSDNRNPLLPKVAAAL